jgi:hypothetical protein
LLLSSSSSSSSSTGGMGCGVCAWGKWIAAIMSARVSCWFKASDLCASGFRHEPTPVGRVVNRGKLPMGFSGTARAFLRPRSLGVSWILA